MIVSCLYTFFLLNHNCEAFSLWYKRFIFSKIFPTHRYQNGRRFSTQCICLSACTLLLLNLAWYIETENIWRDHGSIRSNYLSLLLFVSFPFLHSLFAFRRHLNSFSLYRKLFTVFARSLISFNFFLHCTVGLNKHASFFSFISLLIVLIPLKKQRGTPNILHSFSCISMFLTFFFYISLLYF